jgi:hypothetical protein
MTIHRFQSITASDCDSTRSTVTEVWLRAALWLGLALAATLASIGEREG